MRCLVAALLFVGLLGLLGGTAASAHGRSRSHTLVPVFASIHGWGSVEPAMGFEDHHPRRCTYLPECSYRLVPGRRQVALVATPFTGWKFAGWSGACKKVETRRCVRSLPHLLICPPSIPPGVHLSCTPGLAVGAKFVPAGRGLTRKNPIPVGTAKSIGHGLTVRVDSAEANVQLSPVAGPGEEYFAAEVTVTYTGHGSVIPYHAADWDAEGRSIPVYSDAGGIGCPSPGPQPRLDTDAPISSGQSVSGYLCWTIATSDAHSLQLFFGSGTLHYPPATTWFALH